MRSISTKEISSTVKELVTLLGSVRSDPYIIGYLESTLEDILNSCDEGTRNEIYVRFVDRIIALRAEIKNRQ